MKGVIKLKKIHQKRHIKSRSMKYKRRMLVQAVSFCLLNDVLTRPAVTNE